VNGTIDPRVVHRSRPNDGRVVPPVIVWRREHYVAVLFEKATSDEARAVVSGRDCSGRQRLANETFQWVTAPVPLEPGTPVAVTC
jgi:hypothetical protein